MTAPALPQFEPPEPPQPPEPPEPPEPTPEARHRDRLVAVAVAVAVALAFADASVVALALPQMYATFDTTIIGVSWVLTTYAVAVVVVAVLVALFHRRLRPLPLLVTGVIAFVAASIVAGSAVDLPMLLVARAVQGAAAAMLLAAALPVLTAVTPRGRRWWAIAGALGAAVGPALGGTLTQLFDWRAIFYVQAPIAAVALVSLTSAAARNCAADRDVPEASEAGADPAPRRFDVVVANVGFALVFAALVAALFLGVLMLIEVWRYSPLRGAALVSALPVGMLVGRFGHAAPARWRAVGGCVLLAAGLAALAFVPGERWTFAAAAFGLCGIGFELVHEVLDVAAIPPDDPPVRSSSTSVGARHAGLVLGLIVIAPLLSTSIDAGIQRATLASTRSLLEADLPLSDKIPVTWHLRDAIESAPRGQVPDLAAVFADAGAKGDNALARARDNLGTAVADTMTRAFRPAFFVSAMIALLAALPALIVAMRSPAGAPSGSKRRRQVAKVGIVAAVVAGVGLLGGTAAAGAADVGEFTAADPCTAPPDTHSGKGLDAAVQRIALSALNGAACELHTTRERLVLSLDPNSGYHDVTWDHDTLEHAMRVGADRAIDDADERNSIPGFVASILHTVVEHAPIDWLVNRINLPG